MTEYEKMIHEFKLTYINTSAIKIDNMGQRDVEARAHQFNWIMNNFDPRLIQPITVALIDGVYYCVDGQMTRKVHIAMNHGHLAVPCRVIKCNSLGEAADLFLKQRGLEKAVTVNEKYAVGVNYGDEVENGAKYQAVNVIIEDNGFYVGSTGNTAQNCIRAVSTLVNEYDKFGDDIKFDRYMKILRKAWDGDPDSLQTKILSALGLFVRVYEGQYDENTLARKLSKVSPSAIIRACDTDPSRGPRKYAQQILYAYNKGRSDSTKLPGLFN